MEFKVENKPKVAMLLNGMIEITFTTQKSVLGAIEGLKDETMLVSVKEFRKRRSLSQNAYFWVLIDELAKELKTSREEVYQKYIKEYGVFDIVPIKSEGVEVFKSRWNKNGLGWFCEELGKSKLDGFVKVVVYYGSSTYNSKEMSRVIDAVIEDCQELGIDTLTTNEILSLKNDNDEEKENG